MIKISISVKDILSLEIFQEAHVIAGEHGLSRKVNKANLMEVPDIFPFVDEYSLLITTLYPIYDNTNAIKEIIPRLNDLNLRHMHQTF